MRKVTTPVRVGLWKGEGANEAAVVGGLRSSKAAPESEPPGSFEAGPWSAVLWTVAATSGKKSAEDGPTPPAAMQPFGVKWGGFSIWPEKGTEMAYFQQPSPWHES
jgi:hypothetical protein